MLNDIVNKYNNTYHSHIKMNPIDVKFNSCAEHNVDSNAKDPKLKLHSRVRISKKYKNIFAKGYAPRWFEEIFVIGKIKNTTTSSYVINDLNGEEIVGTFYEKELQKTNQKEFRIEKVIKRKGDKVYGKWKSYDSFGLLELKKNALYKMSQYFPKPYESSGRDINVKVDLSNYATRTDLKKSYRSLQQYLI